MNFASLMSAQIAKANPKSSSPPKDTESSSLATSQKYQKRSEVEAAREEAYRAEQAAIEKERLERASKKRQLEEEEAEQKREREAKRQRLAEESKRRQEEEDEKAERERRKRIGLPDLPPKEIGEANGEQVESPKPSTTETSNIDDDELITKLREINEPARLFGETHSQRLQRYLRLERSHNRSGTPSKAVVRSTTDAPVSTSLEPVAEVDMKVPAKLPPKADTDARLLLSRQIVTWLNLVLREWWLALQRRDAATKATFAGQAATNSHTQALSHLKPLFRKLENAPSNPAELPDDILAPVLDIVRAAQERRYVDANDGYLQLSIGKAAWPIGVTMVGIHERSAREKLHESDKGKSHIMGDEMTRKFLQSLKRCLSFAQTRWPPEDAGQLMG